MEHHGAARDDGRRLEQALDAVGERGLAASALTGESEDLTALEFEGDVLDRPHGGIDVVDDREVVDREQGSLIEAGSLS
nr:hypothetical protein GCM10025699_36040 [Microbacterium flavescens]